jgi:hypothetical protein
MDKFDQSVRESLQDELQSLSLSDTTKEAMLRAMTVERNRSRQNLWRRLAARVSLFWDTTYQLSLAPVAVACVLVVVAGAGIYSEFSGPGQPDPTPPVYFVGQNNGGTVIVPLDGDTEGP